jgi:hypothetical protein
MKSRPETPYANDFITAAGREYDRGKCDDPLRSRGGFQVLSGFSESASLLGDVMAIEQISPAASRWTIQGPLGIRAHLVEQMGSAGVKLTDEGAQAVAA